jgi:hypothetical protein
MIVGEIAKASRTAMLLFRPAGLAEAGTIGQSRGDVASMLVSDIRRTDVQRKNRRMRSPDIRRHLIDLLHDKRRDIPSS